MIGTVLRFRCGGGRKAGILADSKVQMQEARHAMVEADADIPVKVYWQPG
jgi:hypothetical protein